MLTVRKLQHRCQTEGASLENVYEGHVELHEPYGIAWGELFSKNCALKFCPDCGYRFPVTVADAVNALVEEQVA